MFELCREKRQKTAGTKGERGKAMKTEAMRVG